MRIVKDTYAGTVTIIIGEIQITMSLGEWSKLIAMPEGS